MHQKVLQWFFLQWFFLQWFFLQWFFTAVPNAEPNGQSASYWSPALKKCLHIVPSTPAVGWRWDFALMPTRWLQPPLQAVSFPLLFYPWGHCIALVRQLLCVTYYEPHGDCTESAVKCTSAFGQRNDQVCLAKQRHCRQPQLHQHKLCSPDMWPRSLQAASKESLWNTVHKAP